MRKKDEVLEKSEELFDKVWYYRKLVMFSLIRAGKEEMFSESVSDKMTENMRRVEKLYGLKEDWQLTDNEWGYLQGQFAVINWMLGEDWDMIDT
jgi:hypothetical protein